MIKAVPHQSLNSSVGRQTSVGVVPLVLLLRPMCVLPSKSTFDSAPLEPPQVRGERPSHTPECRHRHSHVALLTHGGHAPRKSRLVLYSCHVGHRRLCLTLPGPCVTVAACFRRGPQSMLHMGVVLLAFAAFGSWYGMRQNIQKQARAHALPLPE